MKGLTKTSLAYLLEVFTVIILFTYPGCAFNVNSKNNVQDNVSRVGSTGKLCTPAMAAKMFLCNERNEQ